MKKYVIANWKMAPQTLAEAEEILASVDEHLTADAGKKDLSLVICPPFVFLDDVSRLLKNSHLAQQAELGAQDIAASDSGAWTGEVSGPMLKRLGVKYVIIGHSERRWKMAESDDIVNKKLITALNNELTPIVCIGEKERSGAWQEFLKDQITATFVSLSADQISKCLIAYEPVWAISTNPGAHADTPEATVESIKTVASILYKVYGIQNSKFLYGGSINSSNAKDFLSLDQLAGVLVGGASVNKEEFAQILKAA